MKYIEPETKAVEMGNYNVYYIFELYASNPEKRKND